MTNVRAIQDGMRAYQSRLGSVTNPYERWSDAWWDWRGGFLAAMGDHLEITTQKLDDLISKDRNSAP